MKRQQLLREVLNIFFSKSRLQKRKVRFGGKFERSSKRRRRHLKLLLESVSLSFFFR
jgi:hypothetical protein